MFEPAWRPRDRWLRGERHDGRRSPCARSPRDPVRCESRRRRDLPGDPRRRAPHQLLGVDPGERGAQVLLDVDGEGPQGRDVDEPRAVLAEFGTRLPDDVAIRVHDSTADMRYLVLPMRPEGTEGWSEQQLADLVTRDSMNGTGLPKTPGASS